MPQEPDGRFWFLFAALMVLVAAMPFLRPGGLGAGLLQVLFTLLLLSGLYAVSDGQRALVVAAVHHDGREHQESQHCPIPRFYCTYHLNHNTGLPEWERTGAETAVPTSMPRYPAGCAKKRPVPECGPRQR